ncbi:MAG: restriction endonuclease subunit S, partial [Endomicrobiia bacterium]|nr:restriction endonuclease subunit S [Endomicrobiia bacterium]
PEIWAIKTVGAVGELGRGRVINQAEINAHSGIYPVYSSQSKNDGVFGFLSSNDFAGEYVTWTTDGAHAGTVFYRNGKFNCTNVCGTIKPKDVQVIDARFLAYVLSTRTKRHVSYVGNPKLMNNVMGSIMFPCPPVLEQKNIADVLSGLDTKITEVTNVKRKIEELKKGLMNMLLTGKVRTSL